MCSDHRDYLPKNDSALPTPQRRLVLVIAINLIYVVVEFLLGFRYDSTGLLADAGHNLSDVFGLAVSLTAMIMQSKKASRTFSYGFKSATLLASLVNSLLLMVAIGLIIFECIDKLMHGSTASGMAIMATAGAGIIVNGFTTWLLSSGKERDLNAKGAYLHMLADTLVSAGVVAAGGIILLTHWMWIDPVIGLIIAGIILWSSMDFFKESIILALDGVPSCIQLEAIERELLQVDNVVQVHHIHVWALSTTETALTAQVKVVDLSQLEGTKNAVKQLLEKYHISHSTLEFEVTDRSSDSQC